MQVMPQNLPANNRPALGWRYDGGAHASGRRRLHSPNLLDVEQSVGMK